ncbi:hypothetical protein CRE_24601 [Caenorhabditis remanei]|uniref:PAN-3 domain-containing protein n=1 Tax=Caenorhabditis remanei TaxID=31234 RepID=E3MVE2_CAERE|nr:hypothetical protein CRE_24601 [Caenorhabditis remanei]
MIVTRGTPEVYVNSISLVLTWEECLANCTQNDLCVAVHTIGDGNCQIFEFGDLQTVKRSNDIDSKFAYKVKNENASTCPADDTIGETNSIIGINGTSGRQVYIEYTISYDQTSQSWNFQSMRPLRCFSAAYKMFKRALGPWCITMPVTTPRKYTESASICARTSNSVLSGLDTPEEFEYIKEQVARKRWLNASYPLYASWLSGVRKPECVGNPSCQGLSAFSFADPTLSANPTGYLFNPGKPDGTGEDCLAFRVNSDRTCGIDDIPWVFIKKVTEDFSGNIEDDFRCDQDRTSDNSTWMRGLVCGLPPY